MARRTKAKPYDPREGRRRDFEAVGLQREAADLAQHAQVEVTRMAEDRDGKTVDHNVARRTDAFDALKQSMNSQPRFFGCYDAARRFERDLLCSLGMAGAAQLSERVDEDLSREFASTKAAASVADLRKALGRREFWLLHELIQPTREHTDWRGAVFYVTGEENPNAQGAVVRAACCSLRDAYEAMDEQPRRAA